MVLPMAAAAQAASAAGSAGATALGLNMGKTDLELSRDIFRQQMQQAKRLWTAEWALGGVRHTEALLQASQHHTQSHALALAAYWQAERLALQSNQLSKDQDARSYEMAWRAEVRESLRDDLTNQYNRFNIVMLCDTVCLSCIFTLVADGSLPDATPHWILTIYIACLGISITLFTISLWVAVIVVRRLHEHTAAILERKLFAESEDLQKIWQQQLTQSQPTGPNENYLMDQAYEKWITAHINPLGQPSVHMMALGVVMMFVAAGVLLHTTYTMDYNVSQYQIIPIIIWANVLLTCVAVLSLKVREDRKEKKKQDVYDPSWKDQTSAATGPFAKISQMAHKLWQGPAKEWTSTERIQKLHKQEQAERDVASKTNSKVMEKSTQSIQQGADHRSKIRQEVLQLLTTAAEELEALPDELSAKFNKLLHEIDEEDTKTSQLVSMANKYDIDASNDNPLELQGSSRVGWHRMPPPPSPPSLHRTMTTHPIDAQRISVSLAALRTKLGEASLSTLLRIKNLSEEPLRLKSGVHLKDGKYYTNLKSLDAYKNSVSYHLYPISEIPPRSEVVVAARNAGSFLLPSNIDGDITYTNKSETWAFRIQFRNEMVRKIRKCQVHATRIVAQEAQQDANYESSSRRNDNHYGGENDDDSEEEEEEEEESFWTITKDELDIKANNEIAIVIDKQTGESAALSRRLSQTILKKGYLLKNRSFGMNLQWHGRWVVLTATEIVYSEHPSSVKKQRIALRDITSVQKVTDLSKRFVLEIKTRIAGSRTYRFAASNKADQEDWIRRIAAAIGGGSGGIGFADAIDESCLLSRESSSETAQTVIENGFECVHNAAGTTTVLPL